MSLNTLFIILLLGAAIPANGFVIVYLRAPWRRSVTGRAVMTHGVSLMLLINLGLTTRVLGEGWPGQNIARGVVFTFLFAALWQSFIALLWGKRIKRS